MRSLILSLLALSLLQSTFGQVTEEVQTSSGPVVGHRSSKYPEVSEYLGIRYGQSTGGKNRFLAPKPFNGTQTIIASQFGAACPQTMVLNQSEDCLFINIWTKPQSGEKKKGVLFWIYGGAFVLGDSSLPSTNGASMANNQDVVVVSINYRVNVFGFPTAPTLPQQNLGLLDIRLGIEWARNNIAKFGGDPERITIFGQSAGALAVDYYAYANTKDPIVNGFISSTGNALISLPEPRRPHGAAWYELTKKLGCGGEEAGAKTVGCVQEKPVRAIQMAMPRGTGFNPIVDNITVFEDEDYKARAKEGNFVRKPVLEGANHMSQVGMICSARDSAIARTNANVPAWRFQFSNAKAGSKSGAPNGAEIPYIFGDGKGLSGIFQTAWAAFTKDPAHGLEKLGWPKYQATGKTLVRMAPDQRPDVDFVDPTVYDAVCSRWKGGPNAG